MSRFQWPGFDSTRKLSTEETVELSSRVAELTKAGLPLGEGLRALADESVGRRLPDVLRAMANRLDAGMDLAAAINAEGRRLPTCVRGLVLAGIHTGRLAEVLEEYVDIERSRLELRRRVWLSLAYPLFLLGLIAVLGDIFAINFGRRFANVFEDFGTQPPLFTQLVIYGSGPVLIFLQVSFGLMAAIPLMLQLGERASWIWPLFRRLPLVGPLLRWSHLAQFSRLMALLLEQQVPLPDCLRLTATGLRDPNLARECRRVADEVDNGRSLSESLAARRQFPPTLIPLVQWGQRASALADAFRAAAEMFEGRVRARGTLLESLLLPTLLVVVISFVVVSAVALFMPLLSLMNMLSGGSLL